MEECSGFRVILRGIYLCFFVYIIMKKHILKQKKHKENRLSTLFDVNKRFCFGGEGGIRTLDELLTHTRVPVARQQFEDVLLLFRFISPYLMLSVNYFLCSYGALIVLIQNLFYSVAAGRTAELDFLKLLWYN